MSIADESDDLFDGYGFLEIGVGTAGKYFLPDLIGAEAGDSDDFDVLEDGSISDATAEFEAIETSHEDVEEDGIGEGEAYLIDSNSDGECESFASQLINLDIVVYERSVTTA